MDEASEDKEREKLRALQTIYENAVKTNKMELLKPYLDEDFSFVTMTNKEFTDFDIFVAQWKKTREELLKGGSYEVSLEPDPTRFVGDVAIAKGTSTSDLVTGQGKKFQFSERWTVICQKKSGEWKILKIHSSIDPFKNPFMVDQVKKLVSKAIFIALAIGGLLGWLISKGMG